MNRIATTVFVILLAACGSTDDSPGAWGLGAKGDSAGALIQTIPYSFKLTGQSPTGEGQIWIQPPPGASSVTIRLVSAVLKDAITNWPFGGAVAALDFRLYCDEHEKYCPDGMAAWSDMGDGEVQPNGRVQPETTNLEGATNLRVWVRLPKALQNAMKNDSALGNVQVDLTVEVHGG